MLFSEMVGKGGVAREGIDRCMDNCKIRAARIRCSSGYNWPSQFLALNI